MTLVRVPTPLRPYTEGQKEIRVVADTVGSALQRLADDYPGLRPHLFDESGDLRAYVNIFVNEDDVRSLEGNNTALTEEDRVLIIPSIAGGASRGSEGLRPVDHAALRTNQALIIGLLIAAFVADSPWMVAFVAAVMLLGTLRGKPGFSPVYRSFRDRNLLKPEILQDHPEPHQFSQALGGSFLAAAFAALLPGFDAVGWGLAWFVAALAGLNLFGGFCVGCAFYYWLSRLGVPGFVHGPPPETVPGRRPPLPG